MLEFQAGGIANYSPGAVVDVPYRIENDELVLPPATTGGPEIRETITWLGVDGVRFRSQADLDPGQEFVRIGASPKRTDPILGEWIGSRDMAGRHVQVVRLFREGGRMLLLIPFLTERGSFSVSEQGLDLTLPGKPTTHFRYAVADQVLTLTGPEGTESRYESY